MSLLEIRGLHAGFGRVEVLHGVDLTVDDHGALGLVGPNGHGKSLLLRTIAGLHRPSRGEIRFDGEDITSASPRAKLARGLVHVPQACRLFPDCTVGETLRLGAYGRRGRAAEAETLDRVLELFPRLAERYDQRCRSLSGGERQMVALGAGLMGRPRLLVLDEPTLGLSPLVRKELATAIARVRADGVALLLVDGDLQFVRALTGRWSVMELGRIARNHDADDQVDEAELVAMFFGGSPA